MSIVERGLSGASVFKDAKVLDFNYVPTELPGRDDEMLRLASMFRSFVDGDSPQFVTVQGPVGVGKTVLAKRFTEDLHEVMRKRGKELVTAYVNCRNHRTDSMVMTEVLRKLDPGFPDRGFSVDEMEDALKKRIRARGTQLIVILDEVDVLLRNSQELLYTFSRFDAGTPLPALSVIAISQTDIFSRLESAIASTAKASNRLKLEPYPKGPMHAITQQRVQLAFHKGVVGDDVVELVSDIATDRKNARRAIELLDAAGRHANEEGEEQVTAEMVRTANERIVGDLPEFKLRELPLHEVLTLLAIARRLKKGDQVFGTTGEVEKVYQLTAEGSDEKPRAHTQFWQYLKNLASYGFIDLKKSGAGQAGTTHLISLSDVSAANLEALLLRILAEEHDKTA